MIKVNNQIINPRFFPDGTFNLTDLNGSVFDKAHTKMNYFKVEWRWENPNEYMLLYFLTHHLREIYDGCIHLYLPYIPDARMDRVKHPRSEIFTLKYFAQFINDLHFDEVHVFDPHSNVVAALIDHIEILWPTEFVQQIVNEQNIDVLCFPDEGAMKRYSDDCNFRPLVYGEKKRDWKTGKIKSVIIQNPIEIDLKDKHILIVDDICSRGGTFFYAGRALKDMGVGQIDLFISHCENTILEGDLLSPDNSPISKIYTTNSLSHSNFFNMAPINVMKVFN